MPISHSTQVFKLIKSLTKAEKRNFRIYAKRIQDKEDLLFLKLFDLIDQQVKLNEQELILKLNNISKSKFSNLKRHLYSQIITSLRMLHKEKNANFKVREYIDFAYILYGKGLYIQSLKILNKADLLAAKHHLTYMQLIIVELEKVIETRHITRSGPNKAEELIRVSEDLKEDTLHLVSLSNLRIQMHAKYLKNGHVRNKDEAEDVKRYYEKRIEHMNLEKLGMMERIYYAQSKVWYNFILLDFNSCLKYAFQWVSILDKNPTLKERDVNLYLRGYHYILTCAYHMENVKVHSQYLNLLEDFRKNNYGKFNPNSQIISFLYVHTARLDNLILTKTYENANNIISKSLKRIKKYRLKLDDHKILIFYFKFAWIYLCTLNIPKALHYVNLIINNELNNLREDLQNYARVLRLICHFELSNYEVMNYILKTSENYFSRKKELNPFLNLALEMFSALNLKGKSEHKGIMKAYLDKFLILKEDIYEYRAFLYLDMISWLENKIYNKKM